MFCIPRQNTERFFSERYGQTKMMNGNGRIIIAPSILAADVLNLERDVRKITEAGCDWIHVDVMDAHFVPNMAYTASVVKALNARFDTPLDVHLMMDEPEKYADEFLDAGADVLTIHSEIRGDVRALLEHIRNRGVKAGLAVKPGTPVSQFAGYLDLADMVLTMTVEPGFGGQKLDPTVADKIRELRKNGYTGLIEADGGINEQNLPMLVNAGLTAAVMGTAVFRSTDTAGMISRLHEIRTEETV